MFGLQTVVSVINDKTVVFDKDITTGTILEVTGVIGTLGWDKTVVFDKDITTGTILEVTSLLGCWAANSSWCY